MALRFSLLALLLLGAAALRVPLAPRGAAASRCARPLMMADADDSSASAQPSEEPPPPSPPPMTEKEIRRSMMPTDFLGVFDVSTTAGALGASIVVACGFGLLVETIKFIDPSPASPSVFGSIWS
ncbi:hypothetical protein AB1Y20_022209 [Prymnesium parvum]|uniref:Uncharacterized protein n=1 Tax=Prymnesium parvum TaxID=97485 RepID=A0AB34JIV7_PRYPA